MSEYVNTVELSIADVVRLTFYDQFPMADGSSEREFVCQLSMQPEFLRELYRTIGEAITKHERQNVMPVDSRGMN